MRSQSRCSRPRVLATEGFPDPCSPHAHPPARHHHGHASPSPASGQTPWRSQRRQGLRQQGAVSQSGTRQGAGGRKQRAGGRGNLEPAEASVVRHALPWRRAQRPRPRKVSTSIAKSNMKEKVQFPIALRWLWHQHLVLDTVLVLVAVAGTGTGTGTIKYRQPPPPPPPWASGPSTLTAANGSGDAAGSCHSSCRG